MLILVSKESELDQVHIFQDTYFESSKIHPLTIMYCFEHKNHDILLNFKNHDILLIFKKSLQPLFSCV